ncbi:MAG TPA: pyridoxal phosphate-dependent aminotransferase [Terriglobales bacterium]|nr:pyridoxal phosphate-dependent aminotransferase [Terriglobales bacterium]
MFSARTGWKLTPNRFTQAQEEVRRSGAKILDLTISNPTHAAFDYDHDGILASLNSPASLEYDPQPNGILSARVAVAAYYDGLVEPESLVLTTSTSEGYSFLFRLLCNPGDEVLVPEPSYPLFDFLADLDDVKLAPYLLLYDHGWHIDLPSLRKAVGPRTRAVVVVHPNNPTGSYASAAEREALNAFCAEHGLALIVDEVFLDYAHDGKKRQSFATNRGVMTFTLSGLSKISGLPQMKLAWIAASGPNHQAARSRLEVIADTYLSVNAPMQHAAPSLLDQRKQLQPQLLKRVNTNLAELDRQLSQQKTCSRLDVEGGWCATIRVPAVQSDEDLAIRLLKEASVLVHPGHFYDFPRDGYLVVSLITPVEDFRDGIKHVLKGIL